MSVINQMLRDLEERKLKETSSEHYIDEVNIVARTTISLWWIILPLIICSIVAVNFYLHFLNNNKLSSTSTEQLSKTTQTLTESTILDLPEKISDIKSEIVKNPVELKEVSANTDTNKAIRSLNKKTATEKSIEPPKKNVTVVDDKVLSKTKKEIDQQSAAAKEIITKAEKNNFSIKTQTLKENIPSDDSSINVKVKSPVKVQPEIRKKNTPVNAEKLIYQARLLMIDNQIEAIQLLEKNINKILPNVDYYALLANLNQRRQNYDNAIIYYRKALEIAPNKGEIWIGIALAYQTAGEEQNSINAFKQALTTDNLSLELRAYARQQIGF